MHAAFNRCVYSKMFLQVLKIVQAQCVLNWWGLGVRRNTGYRFYLHT